MAVSIVANRGKCSILVFKIKEQINEVLVWIPGSEMFRIRKLDMDTVFYKQESDK